MTMPASPSDTSARPDCHECRHAYDEWAAAGKPSREDWPVTPCSVYAAIDAGNREGYPDGARHWVPRTPWAAP